MSKLAVAPVTGSNTFEISMDVYYDPATLNTSTYYNWINGRGNNTGFHSGMMIPGVLNENAFEGRWRLQNTGSTISKTGLTADWYRYYMIVTATTFQIKLLNLRTNVLLEGSAVAIGTIDNADNFDYTALCYGISGTTGAYGTVGVNFSNFRITRSGVTLINLPFSSGAGTQVVNVYNGAVYNLAFFTASTGWAKLSDYCHYNFVNGFTLYKKDANPDIRIPNKIDGTETTITPPTGYTRISNHKSSLLAFNQCESKVKLDDVSAGRSVENKVVSGCNIAEINGTYHLVGQNEGKDYWDNDNGYRIVWSSGSWYFAIAETFTVKYTSNAENIWIAESWQIADAGGGLPLPNPHIETVVIPPDDLYSADPDHVLFTEGTGVAKEVEPLTLFSSIVDDTLDRGHLYIDEDSVKNLMLYKTDKGVDTPEDLKVWKYVNK